MGQFEAKGTVQLPGDAFAREHTFHFQDAFDGDVEAAKAHLLTVYPTVKNIRIQLLGKPAAPKAATSASAESAATAAAGDSK